MATPLCEPKQADISHTSDGPLLKLCSAGVSSTGAQAFRGKYVSNYFSQ